jgi:hypothetical protein
MQDECVFEEIGLLVIAPESKSAVITAGDVGSEMHEM